MKRRGLRSLSVNLLANLSRSSLETARCSKTVILGSIG